MPTTTRRRDDERYCPSCDADLRGEPIPDETREHYSVTHYSRRIGIYDRRLDRTVAWRCPDCGYEWPRTGPPTSGLRAEPIEDR